jgi:drug/metabolite transporter (DMT)-like permease
MPLINRGTVVTWRTWTTFWVLCLFWGIPYFFIKLALEDFSPAFVAWSRITLAALVLVPIAWKRGTLLPALKHKGAVVAFAVTELVFPFLLISMGEQWISSSLAGVLIATVPLTVVIIAPLFGVREPMSGRRLFGLLVGLFGVVVLLGVDTISGPQQWAGVACLAVAVVGYAIGPLVVQRYLSDVDELGSLACSLVAASIILLPLALMSPPREMPSVLSMTSIAILGVVCTAIALLLYFYLIHAAGAARASVIAYICPAVAALLGVVVLHEHFGVGLFAGLAIILFGSWLGTTGAVNAPETSKA